MEINQSDEVIPWSVDTRIHELEAEIDRLRTEVEDYKATSLSLLDCIQTLLKVNTSLRDELDHLTDYWRDHSCMEEMDGL